MVNITSHLNLTYQTLVGIEVGEIIVHKKRNTRYEVLSRAMIKQKGGWFGGIVYQDVVSKVIYCRAFVDFNKESWLLASR